MQSKTFVVESEWVLWGHMNCRSCRVAGSGFWEFMVSEEKSDEDPKFDRWIYGITRNGRSF